MRNDTTRNEKMKRLTQEEFVNDVKRIHNDSIDLSEAMYISDSEKVRCKCNVCGTVWNATPNNLKNGRGCPTCSHRATKYTLEEWKDIVECKHGDKYDLSEITEYNSREQKMKVICHKKFENGKEHGVFYMRASSILDGRNCPHCSKELISKSNESKKTTFKEWEEKALSVHNGKYSYHNDYVNAKTKVRITCPIHGDFWQIPRKHIQGQGCPKCGGSLKMSKSEFTERAKSVHGDKYDYSKVEYVNANTKVCVICKKHGEFMITPHCLLSGQGCQKCYDEIRGESLKYTVNEVIEMAKSVHGDKYDYSKGDYTNMLTPMKIICPRHGEFWQTPAKHIHSKQGCPRCNESKLENEISELFLKQGIEFKQSSRFKWLGQQHLDFYLPSYNIAVECQGIQHYEPVLQFGGENAFKNQKERDVRKKQLCEENKIKLLYYTNYKGVQENELTFKDKNKLLENIYASHIK